MVKSRKVLGAWARRPVIQVFTGVLLATIFGGFFLIGSNESWKPIWEVFSELLGVFAALFYSYYWESTAQNLEWDEQWRRNYLNILIELEENKDKLQKIAQGGKALLKTTSWEIYRDDFKGGSSPLVSHLSEIYYIMQSLNISFTSDDGSDLVSEARQYASYCLKLIYNYREYLDVWYTKEYVKAYLERYADARAHNWNRDT